MNPSQPNTPSKEFMEQLSDIIESGELSVSDCNFLVGPESDQQLIPSFRFILATASPVFRAMFYGSLAEKIDPITMPDVRPRHFKVLLDYIYSNKMKLSSLEEASGVYYCAKKFLLPHLQQLCSEYFLSEVNSSNACQVYEDCAQLFEDNKVMDKVNEIMIDATKLVLNDPSFEEIKLSTLLHIFSLDKICVDSEMDLLEAAVRYNKSQGKPTTQNKTAGKTELSIQNAVEKIRFLTVSPKQFAECQARELLLLESEVLPVLLNISSSNTNVPYPSRLCPSRKSRVLNNISKTFSLTVQDVKNLNDELYSPHYYVCDFSWRISVRPEPFPYNDETKEKYLAVYLYCYTNTKSTNWKCKVECQLTLLSFLQTPRTTSSTTQISRNTVSTTQTPSSYTFNLIQNYTTNKGSGNSQFMAWKDVVDPCKGYMKDGAITIQATVNVVEYSFDYFKT